MARREGLRFECPRALPRLLLIGDSITRPCFPMINELKQFSERKEIAEQIASKSRTF